MKIPIEASARHVHLSRAALDILFGEEFELKVRRFLSQPGQFLSESRVEIVGPRGSIENVAILGPLRGKTQVELSITDARKIGIDAPIRESGDLLGSAGCKIVGPRGEYFLNEGVIISKRHIHMPPQSAKECGVKDSEIVAIKINNPERAVLFYDVVVRVNEKFALACHLDTDEYNSAGAKKDSFGEIILGY